MVKLEKFTQPEILDDQTDTFHADDQPCCSQSVLTRSMFTPYYWTSSIFCKHRSQKRDTQLRYTETDEGLQNVIIFRNIGQKNFTIRLAWLFFSQHSGQKTKNMRSRMLNEKDSHSLIGDIHACLFTKSLCHVFSFWKILLLMFASAKLQCRLEKNLRKSIGIRKKKRQEESKYGSVVQSKCVNHLSS